MMQREVKVVGKAVFKEVYGDLFVNDEEGNHAKVTTVIAPSVCITKGV